VGCVVALFAAITGKTPRFRVDGGSNAENLALQNIQVRPGLGQPSGTMR
jgi:NAD+ synthase (glutamine-hydrolysing)